MSYSNLSWTEIKSTAIRPAQQARVAPWGLAGDRRWMVVDAEHVRQRCGC
jgi:uncharacterized protein YcbX